MGGFLQPSATQRLLPRPDTRPGPRPSTTIANGTLTPRRHLNNRTSRHAGANQTTTQSICGICSELWFARGAIGGWLHGVRTLVAIGPPGAEVPWSLKDGGNGPAASRPGGSIFGQPIPVPEGIGHPADETMAECARVPNSCEALPPLVSLAAALIQPAARAPRESRSSAACAVR